jgi:hypothetical protein
MYVEDSSPEDEHPDKFVMCYSNATDHYYLTLHTAHPIDKWGAEWEPSTECLSLTPKDLDNLIEKLQKLRSVPENKALVALYGEKNE